MTSINFKVFDLTQPGFEPVAWLGPTIFGFPDLPEREARALLIWPPQQGAILDRIGQMDETVMGFFCHFVLKLDIGG